MITGRRFSRLHPKAASAVFCKDGFGDGYHLVIRVDLGWAKTLCRKGFAFSAVIPTRQRELFSKHICLENRWISTDFCGKPARLS